MHNDSVWEVSENTVIPKLLMISKNLGIVFLFLGEMQRIAFRLMLSPCVCVCVCLSVCLYAAFVNARKTV